MNPEQGIFSKALSWLFGANWYTSASGYITIIAGLIYAKPEIIVWIPEPVKGVLWNLSQYVAIGGALAFAQGVKSRSVTGGVVQQTETGAAAGGPSTSTIETKAI